MAQQSHIPTPPPPQRVGQAAQAWWRGLPATQRRGYCAIAVGFIAVLFFIGLLPMTRGTWLAALAAPVAALLDWAAPVALVALVVVCGLVIAEALTGTARPHRLGCACLGVALALLLSETSLLFGAPVGGLVGELGAHLLRHLSAPVAQMIIWGGLGLDLLVALRISWRDVGRAARGVAAPRPATPRAVAPPAPALSQSLATPAGDAHTISGEVAAILAGLPRAPLPERAPAAPAPPPLDYGTDAALEALRVPAYLRRESASRAAPPPTTTGEFALPPLPVMPTPAAPPTVPLPPLAAPPAAPSAPTEAITRATRRARPLTWRVPALGLLNPTPEVQAHQQRAHAERIAGVIARTLKSCGVEAEVRTEDISIGPTVLRFGVRPVERVRTDDRGRVMVDADGEPIVVRTRVSRILHLKDDLALALEAKTLRMEAPVPERPYVGIEIPNTLGRMVGLREVLESRDCRAARAASPLAFALGRDVVGNVRVGDLARFPHLLIAGATGSGKSVCLSAIIGSLISQATPDEVRLVLIDPKMVELSLYAGIPHLLAPVITDVAGSERALGAALDEMSRRYRLFQSAGVRNIAGYDALRAGPQGGGLERLPRIVIIIDELADLMMQAGDAIEAQICRLAQLARATGMHLVVATQRPSVDVITGLIKANFPTRIAFMVASGTDSRTILDYNGAEHLLGKGDMLFQSEASPRAERIQGTYVGDDEIARLAQFWSNQATQVGMVPAQWDLADDAPPEDDDDVLSDLRRRTRGADGARR